MDKKEFSTFAMALRTYYPKEQILPNPQAMELWYKELQDIPIELAETALRKWVATNKWSPSIAEIREMASGVQHGETKTWGEAWEDVLRAISKYGMYEPRKALESLDPMTRRAVDSLGFRNICISENIAVERANFRMAYETYEKRQKTEQQLALPLREAIARLQQQSSDGMFRLGSGGIDND